MSVQALGYIGVRSRSVEHWAGYGTRQLGLQRIDKSTSTLAFRMDDRKQRIIVNQDSGDGIGFFGWEVADAVALDNLASRLETSAVKVARGTRAFADERHVADLIVFQDPTANSSDAFPRRHRNTDPVLPAPSTSTFP